MSGPVIVEFGSVSQNRAALDSAAYRLIGTATCQIEQVGDRWACELTPMRPSLTPAELRARFIELVTDENLRERVAEKTNGVRDVILALAFGSLATTQSQDK